MPPQDVMELERANQEVTMLNKQMDQIKKQRTKHTQCIQDYRNKQQVTLTSFCKLFPIFQTCLVSALDHQAAPLAL